MFWDVQTMEDKKIVDQEINSKHSKRRVIPKINIMLSMTIYLAMVESE